MLSFDTGSALCRCVPVASLGHLFVFKPWPANLKSRKGSWKFSGEASQEGTGAEHLDHERARGDPFTQEVREKAQARGTARMSSGEYVTCSEVRST